MTTLAEAAMRAVLLVLLLVACTGSQSDGAASSMSPDAWPQCYALRTGDWTPASGQKLDVTHAPPLVVRLDTQQVEHSVEQKRHRLDPGIPALGQRGLAPSWTRLAADSMELLWSSGYEGVFVTVGVRGDSVSGSARAFTDYGSQALAPVTGWRIACPPDGPSAQVSGDRPVDSVSSTVGIEIDAQSGASEASAPRADLTIVAGDFYFRAPRTVPAGRTTIRLRNLGPRFHHAAILRLAPGESPNAVIGRIRDGGGNSDSVIPGTVSIGGPEGRMPSGDSFTTVDLAPGEYLVVCTIPLDDGAPHATRGMYAPLTVTGQGPGPAAAGPPAPDVVVRMTDYAYTLTSERLRAGWRTLRIQNDGPAEHIAEIAVFKRGRSAADLLKWAQGGFLDAENPKTTLGGSTRLAAGRADDVRIYLAPGRYVIFCMLHGPGDRHHLKLGMLKELIVE